MNNPLKFTDPTGEVIGVDDVLIILVMAYFGGVQANFFYCADNNTNPFNPFNWNWKSWKTYYGILSGGFFGYTQTVENCAYLVDVESGEKMLYGASDKIYYGNLGEEIGHGEFDYFILGQWVDNHSGFQSIGIEVIVDISERTKILNILASSNFLGSNFLNISQPKPYTDEFKGFWGKVKYLLTGGLVDGGHYFWNGKLIREVSRTNALTLPFYISGKIGSYGELARLTSGYKGAIQAHKLVEWRHLRDLGIPKSKIPAVILDKVRHQEITNILRARMRYGEVHEIEEIIKVYQEVYPEEWMNYIKIFLGY